MILGYFNRTSKIRYFKHCYKCTERHPGCQDGCKFYAEDLAEYRKDNAKAEPEIGKYMSYRYKQRETKEAQFKKKMSKIKKSK